MATCGCFPRWPGCPRGVPLWVEMEAEATLLEEPSFVGRPVVEQEAIWQDYVRAVNAYLRHCGYVSVDEMAERAGSE